MKDNELGALKEALEGQYTEPGPGGDPIRNPNVLPTGKNIHALDPQSIPTQAALKSAKVSCLGIMAGFEGVWIERGWGVRRVARGVNGVGWDARRGGVSLV